jgi:hypothetical protein
MIKGIINPTVPWAESSSRPSSRPKGSAPRTSQNGLAARSTVAKRPGRSGLGVVGLAQHCAWPSHAGRARHGAAGGEPVVAKVEARLPVEDSQGEVYPPGKALVARPHQSELASMGGRRSGGRRRSDGGKGYGGRWWITMSSCAREGVMYGIYVEAEGKSKAGGIAHRRGKTAAARGRLGSTPVREGRRRRLGEQSLDAGFLSYLLTRKGKRR